MKFLRLRIWNFLTIGHADVTLNDKGLVLIQGENLDDPSALSNGAGKSSIADALMWALYGETARGEGGDAVVNLKAKKDCYVELTMQDGDTFYEVQRYRKHSKLKNVTHIYAASGKPPAESAAGSILSLHKGTERETQDVLNKIVGCSKDVFQAAIYAGQEQTPDLPGMTDKQLKMLIEEAAGVERLEAAYAVALGRKNTAEKAVSLLRDKIEAGKALRFRFGKALDDARDKASGWESQRRSDLADLAEKSAAHKREASEYATKAKQVKDAGYDVERAKIDLQLASLDTKRKKVDDWWEANGQPLEDAYRRVDDEVFRVLAEERELNKHLTDIDTYLSKPCPTCKRPHAPEERDEAIGFLKVQLHAIVNKRDRLIEDRNEAKLKVDAVEQERLKMLDAIPTSASLMERRVRLTQALDLIPKYVLKAKDALSNAKAFETKREALAAQTNPYDSAIKDNEKKIKEADDQVTALQGDLLASEHDFAIATSVCQVFGPAGVRAHILDTVTPFLNERTAEYLGVLSDGNISATWTTLTKNGKGELKEKFTIEVTNATGAQSFKGLSGGEKRKVRLACMLALQDLVATRATKPIDLWIGDEIDDALDASGLERLMTILDGKAREKGTVLVISHNDLKDWADNVATITKKDGVSTVEGALC